MLCQRTKEMHTLGSGMAEVVLFGSAHHLHDHPLVPNTFSVLPSLEGNAHHQARYNNAVAPPNIKQRHNILLLGRVEPRSTSGIHPPHGPAIWLTLAGLYIKPTTSDSMNPGRPKKRPGPYRCG